MAKVSHHLLHGWFWAVYKTALDDEQKRTHINWVTWAFPNHWGDTLMARCLSMNMSQRDVLPDRKYDRRPQQPWDPTWKTVRPRMNGGLDLLWKVLGRCEMARSGITQPDSLSLLS